MGAELQQHRAGRKILIIRPLAHINILDKLGVQLVPHGLDLLGKAEVGLPVLVALAHQQAHLAHFFPADGDGVLLRVGDAVPVQIEDRAGLPLQQLDRRLTAAAVSARIVRMMGLLAALHGRAQRFQPRAEFLRHVVDAAPLFAALRTVALEIAFVAVGTIKGDLPGDGADGRRVRHLIQPAHIGHFRAADQLRPGGMVSFVHLRDPIVLVIAGNIFVALFALALIAGQHLALGRKQRVDFRLLRPAQSRQAAAQRRQ